MRLQRLVALVSGVAALWFMMGAGAAFAQEDEEEAAAATDFGRTGFYLGAGGTLTKLLDSEDALEDALSAPGSVNVDVESSFGAYGRAGYRFHHYLAAELEGEWHAPFDADFAYGEVEIAKAKVEPLVFTANLKGYLFKDRFQPYAVLGIGAMTAKIDIDETAGLGLSGSDRSTGFAARFGGGADMYITQHIALNAEIRYVLPTGAVEGLDMISFGWGLQYRF